MTTPPTTFQKGDQVHVTSQLGPDYQAQIIRVLPSEQGTLYELGELIARPWPFHRWPKVRRAHHAVTADALRPLTPLDH